MGGLAAGVIACATLPPAAPASGEPLETALVHAYQNNPTLNSQRASTRATDEAVPQALSGYRPKISITGNAGEQTSSTTTKTITGGLAT